MAATRPSATARLVEGDTVTIEAGEHGAQVMLMSAPPTKEPIAWYGPIVMNTHDEIDSLLPVARHQHLGQGLW